MKGKNLIGGTDTKGKKTSKRRRRRHSLSRGLSPWLQNGLENDQEDTLVALGSVVLKQGDVDLKRLRCSKFNLDRRFIRGCPGATPPQMHLNCEMSQ